MRCGIEVIDVVFVVLIYYFVSSVDVVCSVSCLSCLVVCQIIIVFHVVMYLSNVSFVLL